MKANIAAAKRALGDYVKGPWRGWWAVFALGCGGSALAAGHPELTGVWQVVGSTHELKTADGAMPPLKPAAAAVYADNRKKQQAGDLSFDPMSKCIAPGLPRILYQPYPFKIFQSSRLVFVSFQWNRWNMHAWITDTAPEIPYPMSTGVSKARWEGDTLVMETTGLRADDTWLDDDGMPHSEDLRLTERLKVLDHGALLEDRIRFEDPQTFTKPWETVVRFRKRPAGTEIAEDTCVDRLKEGHSGLDAVDKQVQAAASPTPAAATTTPESGVASNDPPAPAGGAGPGFTLRPDAKFFGALAPLPPGSQPPSPDPKDFTGVYYQAVGTTQLPNGPGSEAPRKNNMPSYTATAERHVRFAAEMEAKGHPLAGLQALCRPAVGVRGTYIPGIIVQAPDEVLIIGEMGRTTWHIHLNRSHPQHVKPTYWGDSVGHWEGDTLVVDTIGFNGREALISTQQHLITRIRKIDGGNKLEMKFEAIDPSNYTRPYDTSAVLAWRPDYDVYEDQCEENPQGAQEGQVVEPTQ